MGNNWVVKLFFTSLLGITYLLGYGLGKFIFDIFAA